MSQFRSWVSYQKRTSPLPLPFELGQEPPVESKFEAFLSGFVREATDYRTILPMLVGSAFAGMARAAAFRGIRGGTKVLSGAFTSRFLAASVASAVEIPIFATTSRWLRDGQLATPEDVAHASLGLGAMRLLQGAASLFSKHSLIQHGGGFAGIYGAQWLEEGIGLRPGQDGESRLIASLAAWVSASVGSNLGARLLGTGYARFQAELMARGATTQPRFTIPEFRHSFFAGVRGKLLPMAGIGTGLMTLMSAQTAHAATQSLGASHQGWGDALLSMGISLGILAIARSRNLPKELERFRRIAESPSFVSLQDVEDLYFELRRSGSDLDRAEILLEAFINTLNHPILHDAAAMSRIRRLSQQFARSATLEEVERIAMLIRIRQERALETDTWIILLDDIFRNNADDDVICAAEDRYHEAFDRMNEHAHRFLQAPYRAGPEMLWQEIESSAELHQIQRLALHVAKYLRIVNETRDFNMVKRFQQHRNVLIRSIVYRGLAKVRQGRELARLWNRDERYLLTQDLISGNPHRRGLALIVLSAFEAVGIQEARAMQSQVILTRHFNGEPKDVYLVRNQFIQGLPCAADSDVAFYPDGKLKRAKLSDTVRIEGKDRDLGSIVEFGEDGAVIPPNM